MTVPAMSRVIGQAERTMRTLLERELERADLTFPEWTALVFVDISGPLTREELVRRQVHGHVASQAAAGDAIDRLRAGGLLAPSGEGPAPSAQETRLALTPAAEAVFRPIRTTVSRITDELYGDLPLADLQATQRTLAEITRRGDSRLAADAAGGSA